MIGSHLEMLRELDDNLDLLAGDLAKLRAEYMKALDAGNHEAFVRISRDMDDKVGELKTMLDRIQSYFSGAIPQAFAQGARYGT